MPFALLFPPSSEKKRFKVFGAVVFLESPANNKGAIMAPDNEKVKEIVQNIFTPALIEAFKAAKDAGNTKEDAIYAAANAYMNIILHVVGDKREVIALLNNQVKYLTDSGSEQAVFNS